jgi:hypothetical protein
MAILTVKQIKQAALNILNQSFAYQYPPTIEYHARRTDEDPKIWKVVELTMLGKEVVGTKELATDLKRNRAEALVKLLRGNQKHGS